MPGPREFAPAKVNLYLHVTGRREDGYHLLDSLAVFPDIGDRLRYEPADGFSLGLCGPFAAGLSAGSDNLVLRAGRALAAHAGIAATGRLTLDKRLPVASGIGGGSADAAAALRLLSRVWHLALPGPEMHDLARRLGADVPVCLAGAAARMSGIGDALAGVPPLPACGIVLVNPGAAVATPSVFHARTGGFSPPAGLAASWPDAASLARDLSGLRNDLEPAAISLCPAIAEVLAALRSHPATLLARMSGSGATCFALCTDVEAAAGVAAGVHRTPWWTRAGRLA